MYSRRIPDTIKSFKIGAGLVSLVLLILFLMLLGTANVHAQAAIEGLHGTSFSFIAMDGYITLADSSIVYMWGYADGSAATPHMQNPGPTLILDQGVPVTITLRNALPPAYAASVSLLFPGQTGVTAAGGTTGILTQEAPPDNLTTVTYQFTPQHPGTYTYYSGTRMELQTEMGLFGAIIVRPSGFDQNTRASRRAYGDAGSVYDHEYLYVLSEIDPVMHERVEFGFMNLVDNTAWWPTIWLINGRVGPDTMSMDNVEWLPNQPYSCMPRLHPGEQALFRVIGAGRASHPLHSHGNHTLVIARNGRLLESAPGNGPDLAELRFTITASPGETTDALFTWTGEQLGWDIYGTDAAHAHTCVDTSPADTFDDVTHEYCPDHGKPFPVDLPHTENLTFGPHWSGSPLMGTSGELPPGEGGFNPNNGFFFMSHSHNEKEITTNNLFPGGLMTMIIVEPPGVPIP